MTLALEEARPRLPKPSKKGGPGLGRRVGPPRPGSGLTARLGGTVRGILARRMREATRASPLLLARSREEEDRLLRAAAAATQCIHS